MNLAVQLLTIFTFTIHVIAGCCAHHDHDRQGHAPSLAGNSVISEACNQAFHADEHACHHDHSSKASEKPGHAPCDQDHPCTAGTCSYLIVKVANGPLIEGLGFPGSMDWPTGLGHVISHSRLTGLAVRSTDLGQLAPCRSHQRCTLLQTWQV